MWVFRAALDTIRNNRKEYAALNLLYYGLVGVSMVYSYAFPEIQMQLMEALREEFVEVFPLVVEAYTSGNFLLAVALTFSINLVLGSFVYITLPSFFIPFSGIVMGCIRAVGWGLLLAPTSPELATTMIPHSLTLILEGQGYILAMFSAYIHWKGVIWPKQIGKEKRFEAYLAGIKKTIHIYLLVAFILAISAIYEAFEVMHILGRLG